MGKPKTERGKHGHAFEVFFALGSSRSLEEVGRRLGVSGNTIGEWSKAFRWKERIAEREKFVSELVAQKAIEDEATSRANALKICRAVQIKFAQSLQSGTALICAADFEKAVKLELLLRGQATDRTEILVGPLFQAFIDRLSLVIEREVLDPSLRERLALGFQEAAGGSGAMSPKPVVED